MWYQGMRLICVDDQNWQLPVDAVFTHNPIKGEIYTLDVLDGDLVSLIEFPATTHHWWFFKRRFRPLSSIQFAYDILEQCKTPETV